MSDLYPLHSDPPSPISPNDPVIRSDSVDSTDPVFHHDRSDAIPVEGGSDSRVIDPNDPIITSSPASSVDRDGLGSPDNPREDLLHDSEYMRTIGETPRDPVVRLTSAQAAQQQIRNTLPAPQVVEVAPFRPERADVDLNVNRWLAEEIKKAGRSRFASTTMGKDMTYAEAMAKMIWDAVVGGRISLEENGEITIDKMRDWVDLVKFVTAHLDGPVRAEDAQSVNFFKVYVNVDVDKV